MTTKQRLLLLYVRDVQSNASRELETDTRFLIFAPKNGEGQILEANHKVGFLASESLDHFDKPTSMFTHLYHHLIV